LKNKFLYLATLALMAGGTALAQSSVFQQPSDSYSSDLQVCKRTGDHGDAHGVLGQVRRSERMRAFQPGNAAPGTAPELTATAQTETPMNANQGAAPRDSGSRPGAVPPGVK
jgi:hypothetical protein